MRNFFDRCVDDKAAAEQRHQGLQGKVTLEDILQMNAKQWFGQGAEQVDDDDEGEDGGEGDGVSVDGGDGVWNVSESDCEWEGDGEDEDEIDMAEWWALMFVYFWGLSKAARINLVDLQIIRLLITI